MCDLCNNYFVHLFHTDLILSIVFCGSILAPLIAVSSVFLTLTTASLLLSADTTCICFSVVISQRIITPKIVSEEILLLRSPQAPCGYAARANSEGAKLSFAFSLID